MAVTKTIVINENFALDKIPDASCDLVSQITDDLLGSIDLQGLITNLAHIGKFIRFAYNGVVGHTELQIQIQTIGCNLTNIADKFEQTIYRFKITSKEALQSLQVAYEYLLIGFEEMAMESLCGLAEKGGDIEKVSQELHVEIEAARKDICSALENTRKAVEKQVSRGEQEEAIMQENPEQMRNHKDKDDLAVISLDAMKSSIDALESLSANLRNARLFWENIKIHCKDLASEDMKKRVENVMKLEKAKRFEIWSSPTFKNIAIPYYLQWVALEDVCTTYLAKIKETRQDLYSYMRENPTREESYLKVREFEKFYKRNGTQIRQAEVEETGKKSKSIPGTLIPFNAKE